MQRIVLYVMICLSLILSTSVAFGFCGFYVAKADTKLFNRASQVVLVRYDDKTVLTMSNDYWGDLTEFAIVIPVPTFIERDQIHVANKALLDHLDAYSAPRLVEYFDDNPCRRKIPMPMTAMSMQEKTATEERARTLGVTVEARYTVGEYDIIILSATQSKGLEIWLRENGYRIPAGASGVLGSYIKQGMRFFVAKVNLREQARLGFSYLRPIQVAYESPRFMLPIRLGMINADGPQELFVYTLTRKGRVETTNYRTVKLPTGMDLPVYVKEEFAHFYRAMFTQQVQKENMQVVFLEYAWDMNWCDPCAADPLSAEELRELGVFWLDDSRARGQPAQEVFITRLHLRYDAEHFPEDLRFQETADRTNFQARYVLRHPWTGEAECPEAERYRENLRQRHVEEAQTLARLTGWSIEEIREQMDLEDAEIEFRKWYQKIWKD